MIKDINNTNLLRKELLKKYLKNFLIYLNLQLQGVRHHRGQNRNNELVQHFIELVEKNFKTKKKVADYARQLFVTPNYLNEIIKKITGQSAGHHIRQRIVLQAKRHPPFSILSIKKTA